MTDSLIIGEQIELIGSVVSMNPLCAGAVFLLQPGYDLGEPQPVTSVIGSLLLDGSRPFGYQAGNRTITLPVEISVPGDSGTPAGFQTLTAAREVLLREINQQTWTLRWTRDPGGGTPLPVLFDCFRAAATVVAWGGVDTLNRFPIGLLTISFEALPYARTDLPVTVDFPSPLSFKTAPPPVTTIDAFAAVSGTQWAASTQSPVLNSASAFWDPSIGPADNPAGTGVACTYTKTGLSVNLAQGWTALAQATGSTTQMTVLATPAGLANNVSVGDQFQLAGNFLTGQNTGFEGGLGSWAAQTNCAVADSAAQAHTGSDSMAMTSTAAGNMSALYNVTPAGSGMPVLPGDDVLVSGWFRAATVARQCQMGVIFYDQYGTQIGTTFGAVPFGAASIADTTTGWTQAVLDFGLAPAGAQWALPAAQVLSAGAASEVHYVDDVAMVGRGSALLQTQIFTVTSLTPPGFGFQSIVFTPAASAATVIGNVAVQTGPPRLNAITFWAGFGSTKYYTSWARLGGRVTFAMTLTDTYASTLKLSQTVLVTGSNATGIPKWNKIQVPVPASATFDYANVTGYSVTITNRGTSDLRYTQCYLAAIMGAPTAAGAGTPTRGTVYELTGLAGSARAPCSLQFQQPGTQSAIQTFTVPGTFQWLCPAGVTSVDAFAIGGGGGGARFNTGLGGGGGGGGGSAQNTTVAVTPGNYYTVVVGAGGNAYGLYDPPLPPLTLNGQPSTFTGDSVTVTANGGTNASGTSGGAGGAAGAGGYAGGAGGTGVNSATGGGGGGASSAGSLAIGNPGNNASGSTGGASVGAPVSGGQGGRGGTFGHGNGVQGGPGGGSGGSPGGASGGYYPGNPGEVVLTYNQTPTFQTLLVHRPPVTAPRDLMPFVSPSIGDTPNGLTYYPLQGLVPGVNARFGGTYTVVAVAWSWTTPAVSRTITVGVTQNEQPGGATYYSQVQCTITPNTLPNTTDTNALYGPMVVVGEMTLPLQDIPPDNTHCNFVVDIASSITTDAFMDILFLDTMGSTVLIQSPTGYVNYYLDEPPSDRDLGLIGGSLFDRGDAISVLDRATVAGGPVSIDPFGNPMLLVYAAEGAPGLQMTYFPRWALDRIT